MEGFLSVSNKKQHIRVLLTPPAHSGTGDLRSNVPKLETQKQQVWCCNCSHNVTSSGYSDPLSPSFKKEISEPKCFQWHNELRKDPCVM